MKKSKAILMALCAVLLVAASVMGTLAYLTSTDTVTNTFTVGNVVITLDETDVDINGVQDGTTRVKANTYKLMPGHEYIKDPVVHVDEKSEPCYIRTIVTVSDIASLKNAFPADNYPTYYSGDVFLLEKLVKGWDSSKWACVSATAAGVYEFRYVGTGTDAKGVYTYSAANKDLPALFEKVAIPGDVDNARLAYLNNVQITVVANAIQADGFADAEAAWKEF